VKYARGAGRETERAEFKLPLSHLHHIARERAYDCWVKSVHSSWRYLPTTRDMYEPIMCDLGLAGRIVKHDCSGKRCFGVKNQRYDRSAPGPQMTLLPPGVKVHLPFGYTDMRKGIDGLAMLVQGVLRPDPFSGHLWADHLGHVDSGPGVSQRRGGDLPTPGGCAHRAVPPAGRFDSPESSNCEPYRKEPSVPRRDIRRGLLLCRLRIVSTFFCCDHCDSLPSRREHDWSLSHRCLWVKPQPVIRENPGAVTTFRLILTIRWT
jgi:IS66 Orf2 like protein